MSTVRTSIETLISTKEQGVARLLAAQSLMSKGSIFQIKRAIKGMYQLMIKYAKRKKGYTNNPAVIAECGQAMEVFRGYAVKPLLRILDEQKDDQLHLTSQRAMYASLNALSNISDSRVMPGLIKYYEYSCKYANHIWEGPDIAKTIIDRLMVEQALHPDDTKSTLDINSALTQSTARSQPNLDKLIADEDVDGLIEVLTNKVDNNVRQSVAEALINLGKPAVNPLLEQYKKTHNSEVTKEILLILAKMGQPAFRSLIDLLVEKDQLDITYNTLLHVNLDVIDELISIAFASRYPSSFRMIVLKVITSITRDSDDADFRCKVIEGIAMRVTYFGSFPPELWPEGPNGTGGIDMLVPAYTAIQEIGDIRVVTLLPLVKFDQNTRTAKIAEQVWNSVADNIGLASVEPILDLLSAKRGHGDRETNYHIRRPNRAILFNKLRDLTGQDIDESLDDWRRWWEDHEQIS